MSMTHVPETSTSFRYQMRLISKFMVPETNMADENSEADATAALFYLSSQKK